MKPSKAKKVYAPVLKSLAKSNYKVYYKYVDVVGNGTDELVTLVFPNEGMHSKHVIYTISSGKAKRVMNRRDYGYWSKLTAYKKTGALVFSASSHGGDSYSYCRYVGGKYKWIAFKSRAWATSYDPSPSWSYSVPNGSTYESISKSAFSKKVKPLLKGTTKKVSFKKMKLYSAS